MNLQFVNTAVNNSCKVLRKSNNDHTLKGQLDKNITPRASYCRIHGELADSGELIHVQRGTADKESIHIGLANQFFGVL